MNAITFEVGFLTPALIAGAYPKTSGDYRATAELRAASLRGQLRWWFRFLGNDLAAEERIFGHTAGDEGSASGFVLRITRVPEPVSKPMTARDIGLHSKQIVEYLAFNLRLPADARSMFVAGASFHFTLLNHRLMPSDWQRLLTVVRVFCHFGSLGTRSRRGFGALEMISENGRDVAQPNPLDGLPASHVTARVINLPRVCTTPTDILIETGNWLREQRSAMGHDKNRIYGTAGNNSRQASRILLRPVRHNGSYQLIAIGRTEILSRALGA
jgi:CRISPR-associated protein Cmr1